MTQLRKESDPSFMVSSLRGARQRESVPRREFVSSPENPDQPKQHESKMHPSERFAILARQGA
jgi:hypothetical protein